jgi:hypothetical protein
MAARDPLFVPDVTSPTDARLALSGLMAPDSGGVAVRAGAFYGPSVFNVTGMAAMSYSVAGGVAVVTRGASVGPYVGANDGATTVPTTAAPGSGSRYDLIYIKLPDVEQGDADSNAVFGVVQGTAGGSPTIPTGSLPTGAVAIATALVPSGTTQTDTGVTINKIIRYTAARGAPIVVRNQAERDELTQYAGLVAHRLDTGLDNISDGTSWDNKGALTVFGQSAPLKLAYGSDVDTTTVNGNIIVDTGLTSVLVFVAVNGDAAAHDDLVLSIVKPYSGGEVTVKATKSDTSAPIAGSSVRYDWIAIGSA